ncbi:signal peptidase I [Cellulomonas sp. Y8]|uniref:signal peptidase I n=1 Tax=Cellulomonas sp. Y8 TaxID=2591145 RepID=UPI003D7319BC
MNASRMVGLGRRVLTGGLVAFGVLALGLGLAQRAGVVGVLEVQGGSMQPAIANGSLLITVPRATAEVRPGDVVSIVGADHIRVTHRVVDVVDDQVTTRGDANSVADPAAYTGDRLDLVVWHAPLLGVALRYVSMAVREPVLVGGLVLAIGLTLPWERLRRPRGRHRADAIELLAVTR